MKKEEIIDAYLFLRKNNHSVPDAVLDFMKDVSLRELERIKNGRHCFSCQHDGYQQVYSSPCTGCGADGEMDHFRLKR